jgi:transposase, IS5 family
MLVDRYEPEDVFARVPEVVAQTDPVLKALDRLLGDDELYRQVRAGLGSASASRWCMGGTRPRFSASC